MRPVRLTRYLLHRTPWPPGLPGLPGVPALPGVPELPCTYLQRCYSETQKPPDPTISKDLIVNPTEAVRVRRAGREDAARVLRLVRSSAPPAWAAAAAACSQPCLTDYVARTLAQGHTLLAEGGAGGGAGGAAGGGRGQLRGAAVALAASAWDARLLELWARCVRCATTRRLLAAAAGGLRAPALHEKYNVNRILQVILIVPPDQSNTNEVITSLIQKTIQKGKEANFPLLRFDATNNDIVKSIEKLQLNLIKECGLCFQLEPLQIRKIEEETFKKYSSNNTIEGESTTRDTQEDNKTIVTVYSMKPGAQADFKI